MPNRFKQIDGARSELFDAAMVSDPHAGLEPILAEVFDDNGERNAGFDRLACITKCLLQPTSNSQNAGELEVLKGAEILQPDAADRRS